MRIRWVLGSVAMLVSLSGVAAAEWTTLPAPNVTGYGGGCNRMQFFDANTGYIAALGPPMVGVGFTPAFIKTTDGGTTWTGGPVSQLGSSLTGRYAELHFADASNGYMAWDGGGTKIAVTTNAGDAWTQTNVPAGTPQFVWAINATTAIASGNAGTNPTTAVQIWRTTNSGTQWTPVYTGATGYSGRIQFFDANIGVTSVTGQIVRTTDGGATWNPIANTPPITDNKYARLSATEGFLQGHNQSLGYLLYKTTDAGATWTQVGGSIGCTVLSIAFVDAQNGVAGCSSAANVTKNRYTADGGVTWTDESWPAGYGFLGATAGNGITCLAFPTASVAYGANDGSSPSEKRLIKRTPGSGPMVDAPPDASVLDDASMAGPDAPGGNATGDEGGGCCGVTRGGADSALLAAAVLVVLGRRRRRAAA